MTTTGPDSITVMLIGLEPLAASFVSGRSKVVRIIEKKYDSEIFEAALDPAPAVIFCGTSGLNMSTMEVAQSIRMLYSETPIYFVTSDRVGFNRPDMKKNGFNDGFILPNDELELSRCFKRDLSTASGGAIRAYKTVQLIDIPPEETLGFDLYIYLPANNKEVRYASANESLGEERAKKLGLFKHQTALVSEDQLKNFYQFTARQLKAAGSSESLSQTEKTEKREKAVRDLLTGLFADNDKDSIDSGREMMLDCQEIVKAYVLDGASEQTDWYERLANVATETENSSYSRAATASTYAALFGIALGIGDPKELALAGLLYDIGLVTVPAEITSKEPTHWTREERALYEQHPKASVRLIKERRMNVSENICMMIEQHHERFDGNGYPEHIPGPRIMKEAQILLLADMVTELTTLKEGQPRISVHEAILKICEQGLKNPMGSAINIDILRRLKSIFAVAA